MEISEKLVILDSNGRPRISMDVVNDCPSITLLDSNGYPRISMDIVTECPAIYLYDANGFVRSQLALVKSGDAYLRFEEASGMPKIGLGIQNEKCGLCVQSSQGRPRINIEVSENLELPKIEIKHKNNDDCDLVSLCATPENLK
jgi:hypothetical protein